MKVGIIISDSNGCYPVPASRGGAVSTLVEHLVRTNNSHPLFVMEIISYYDKRAVQLAGQYPNIAFRWVKVPRIVKILDNIFFEITRVIFKKRKTVSFKSIFSLMYFIFISSYIIKKDNYDKLVIENNVLSAWIIKLSHYHGEYYYHFHNVPRVGAKCQKIFQNCKAILCVSNFVAAQITSNSSVIGKIDSKRVKILYNCIDTELFRVIENNKEVLKYRDKYGIKDDDKVIVFVGRLSEEKGIDKLLNAIELIDDEKVKALIVGSYMYNLNLVDKYQIKLRDYAKKLGNRIIFTGYIEQKEMPYVYALAKLAVLPSMWEEPAGLTMIEAIACGIPVITTNSGGIPEYVGKFGVILNRDEYLIQNLKDNIYNLLAIDKLKDSKTLEGMHYIKDNLNAKNYLQNFFTFINEE